MSNVCDVTGAKPSFGNSVSHSHRRTRRRWNPNIQRRSFRLSDGTTIRLNVSTTAIKIIDRDGIDAVVSRLRSKNAVTSRSRTRTAATSGRASAIEVTSGRAAGNADASRPAAEGAHR